MSQPSNLPRSAVFRAVAQEYTEEILRLQDTLVDSFPGFIKRVASPHLTIAAGRRAITDRKISELRPPQSTGRQLALETASTSLLGTRMGVCAVSLIIVSKDGTPEDEHTYYQKRLYEHPTSRYRPHITLGRISAQHATIEMLEYIDANKPPIIVFDLPHTNDGRSIFRPLKPQALPSEIVYPKTETPPIDIGRYEGNLRIPREFLQKVNGLVVNSHAQNSSD